MGLLPVASLGLVLLVLPTAAAEGPGYGGGADQLTVDWVTTPADSSQPNAPEPVATPSPAATIAPSEEPAPASEPAATQEPAPAPEPAATQEPAPAPEPAADAGVSAAAPTVVFSSGRGASVLVLADSAPGPDSVASSSDLTLTVGGVGFRGLSAVQVRVGSSTPLTARADETGTLRVLVPVQSDTEVRAGMSVVALGNGPSGTAMTLVGSIPPRPLGTGPVDLVPWIALAVLLAPAASWLLGRVGTPRRRPTVEGPEPV